MESSRSGGRRDGFTLVEVALAIAVGLMIVGGAVLTYQALRKHAADIQARDRIEAARGLVEEYASVNAGNYPVAGTDTVAKMWRHRRTDDVNTNPWGGTTLASGGMTERGPLSGGATSTAAVDLATAPSGFPEGVKQPSNAGLLLYMSATNSNQWLGATDWDTQTWVTMKGYAVTIFDGDGYPYWGVRGGK